MSTVQEIKAAIQNLSPAERKELAIALPVLLPELDGDVAWQRILRDARPRPALTGLLDEAQTQYQRDPTALAETSDAEFNRNS